MSISLNNSYRAPDLTQLNIVEAATKPLSNEVTAAAVGNSFTDNELIALRDSLEISLKAAINSTLSTHPLVKNMTNDERAQLIGAVESSLKQGLGVSSLLRIIQNNR